MSATRRTACDRCHGQKMRCIRGVSQVKCQRCQGAGADCIFSLAKRAGRPCSISNNDKHPKTPQQQPTGPSPTSPTPTRPHFFNEMINETSHFSSPFQRNEASSAPLDTEAGFSPQLLSIPTPSLSVLHDWDESLSAPSLVESAGSLWHWDQNYDGFGLENLDGVRDRSSPVQSHEVIENNRTGNRHNVPPGMHATAATGDAMRQLSELSGTLFAQIAQVESGRRSDATGGLHAKDDQIEELAKLTAHVIESSQALHSVLCNMLSAFEVRKEHTAVSSSSDTATILQILTAYIRLAQLHYALYTRIHIILLPLRSTSPASDQSVPILFTTLNIGGVSLSRYPRFQLKFILQICVDHLGKVEALLGLPSATAVSDRRHTDGRSILHGVATGTVLLVRAIMSDADEIVRGIRRVLAELTEDLKGSIQI